MAQKPQVDRISELHAEICRTLGSAARIRMIGVLRDGERTVNQLAEALGMNQANVSQHLAVLRQKGAVKTRKDGPNVYYSVSNPKIIRACDLMREVLVEQLRESEELAKSVVRRR